MKVLVVYFSRDGHTERMAKAIARRCAVRIAESQKDMTAKFPNIVVQNT